MADNKLNQSSSLGSVFGNLATNELDQLYGIVSTRSIVKYASGARAQLKVNGEIIGFCFDINWNIETQQKEINTIDNYLPEDTAPTIVRVTGSMSNFHIPGQGPTKKEHQSNVVSFMHHKYITIEVRDSQSDELIFYTDKAFITNRSQGFQAGRLSRMTLNWTAIGFLDELRPTVNNGNDVSSVPR